MNLSAVILAGGNSRRMGREKASLPFGGEPMLTRVVRLVSELVPAEGLICVAAKNQTLPPLPKAVQIVHDRQADCGPLEGLATGLALASTFAQHAFVTTCDAPLLAPTFVDRLAKLIEDFEAAVPRIDGQWYPLSAMYRTSVFNLADARLQNKQRRVIDFVEEVNVRAVTREELEPADPKLLSLRNCNTVDEYETLLQLLDAK